MKKKILISIVVVIIIMVLLIILTIIYINLKKNSSILNENDITAQQEIENGNTIVISDKEIQLELISKEEEKENASEEMIEEIEEDLFEEKVLNNECKKRNITLSDEEDENLQSIAFNNSISDSTLNKIYSVNMTEEEYRVYFYNKLVKMEERVSLKEELLNEINNNDISIDNKEFKDKVKNFNDGKDSDENIIENLQNLLNEYIDLLKESYTLEIQ